ncbi:phage tail protein I [Labrenzia sp. R4_1]|uniref:phage tail protein I n=1 Tax=Labrenzia sp. R4_1 TaxID=2821106 RepID=UPI001ADB2680|nr:phage tail protein I [Labrenzia sp. R4_1]MBO9424692.1 phage tail protein I [Labrenzia sp. R4_1]
MAEFLDILPDSTAPAERALAKALGDDLPVPLARQMNPYDCDAENLPHLAAHNSVDLWFDDWPEDRKREIIAQYAGRSTVYQAQDGHQPLPELKGSHEGVLRYLEFVDAEIIDSLEYPVRFVFGQSSFSFTPLQHPPFKKTWLIKVELAKPVNAFVFGRSAWGQGAFRSVDQTPVDRVRQALRIAKAPETEYLLTTAWRRSATFEDDIPDDILPVGFFVETERLL